MALSVFGQFKHPDPQSQRREMNPTLSYQPAENKKRQRNRLSHVVSRKAKSNALVLQVVWKK